MVTGIPPSETLQAPRKGRIWPWAAGSILIPLAIIVTTLAGSRFVAQQRLAAMITPASALPPLRVSAVIQPPGGVALWAPASLNGKPVTLVYNAEFAPPLCLPDATCPAPLASQLTSYDVTGGRLFTRSITPVAVDQCALAPVDAASVAYLVCPGQVQVISLDTGVVARQFSLPTGMDTAHAALDGASNTLYVTGSGVTSAKALFAFNLTTGKQIASQPLSGQASAPIVDASQGRVFTLVNGGGAHPTLLAFTPRTLQPVGGAELPAGWRTGPHDASTDDLFLFGQGGAVGAINLAANALTATQPYPTITPDKAAPLTGARALGWDAAQQTVIALYNDHITAYDGESLQPYASSPISGAWDAQRPLPVDDGRGLVYAPDASGAIVALSLARPTALPAPDAATAVVMARAGLGALLPDTNQTPPFLDTQTFPATQTTLARDFAIHYSDLGWRGPYPGHASAKVVKAGAQPGDYIITFAVDWNQLFVHTHSWTVELLADGRVRLLTDTGDSIP